MKLKSFLILGCGYTGEILTQKISERLPDAKVFSTRRAADISHLPFDLEHADSWNNLPEVDGTFWLFPAEPFSSVEIFLKEVGPRLGQMVVLGTTGSFLVSEEDALIVENSPLDLGAERVRSEEKILELGGIVIRASGIYGPDRNPIDWLKTGKIGPSEKLVNFIHVRDLSDILIAAMMRGKPGARYLAADGQPFHWNQLIDRWKKEFKVKVPKTAKPSSRPSKKVDPAWTLEQLEVNLQYPSVLEGVEELMRQ